MAEPLDSWVSDWQEAYMQELPIGRDVLIGSTVKVVKPDEDGEVILQCVGLSMDEIHNGPIVAVRWSIITKAGAQVHLKNGLVLSIEED